MHMIVQHDATPRVGVPSVPRTWLALCARTAPLVSYVVRMLAGSAENDGYAPDPFSTEMPFLKDGWPGNDW
jgi:hypothetical protein